MCSHSTYKGTHRHTIPCRAPPPVTCRCSANATREQRQKSLAPGHHKPQHFPGATSKLRFGFNASHRLPSLRLPPRDIPNFTHFADTSQDSGIQLTVRFLEPITGKQARVHKRGRRIAINKGTTEGPLPAPGLSWEESLRAPCTRQSTPSQASTVGSDYILPSRMERRDLERHKGGSSRQLDCTCQGPGAQCHRGSP